MRLDVTWTPTGPAAIEVLRARLDQLRGGNPLAPAVVLARDRVAALYVRRRLGATGGVANVQVTTLSRYITQLAGPAMSRSGRRGLPVGAWRQLVRGALARNPGRFQPVMGHPRTVATVATALAQLRREGRGRRAEVARTPHGRHLVELLEMVETDMAVAAEPWFDDTDEADAAAAALAAEPGGPPVISFLPRPSRPATDGVLAALAEAGRLHVIAGRTGSAVADAPLVNLLVQLGAAPPSDWDGDDDPTRVVGDRLPDRVVVVPDADIEARVALAEVAAAMRAGRPLGALAVTAPTAEGRRRLGELFDAAGLPWNGPADLPVAASVVGALAIGVLDLPRLNFPRHAVLSLLAGAPVQMLGGPVPLAQWGRLARDANVTEGLPVWAERLALYGRRHPTEAEDCEALAAMVARLARVELAPGAGWAARVQALEALIEELLGPLSGPAGAGWTERDVDVASGVRSLLHALAGLDALGGEPPSAEEFRAAVVEALAGPGPRQGKVGVGVTVAPPAEIAAGAFDLVVVTGLVEGLAPGRAAPDPLLEELDQAAAEDRRAEQLCAVLSAMAAGTRAVALTARSDRQAVRRPSRWLLAWCGELAGLSQRALGADDLVGGAGAEYQPGDHDGPWHRVVPSFSALARQHAGGSDQDLVLASLHDWVEAGWPPEHHPAVDADPALARAMAVIGDLAAPTVGPATGAGLPEELTESFSSSSLQEYTTCPRRFFYHHVLRVAELADPADEAEAGGLARGSLMHEVLEGVVPRHHQQHPGEPWTDDEIDEAVAVLQAGWAAKSAEGLTGVGAAEDAGLYQLEGVLRRALAEDSRRIVDEGLTLVGTELGFGDRAGGGRTPRWPSVTLTTPAGRTVPVTGRLDRLDRDPDGNLVVTDYKTGTSRYRYRAAGPEYLQLSVYELVAGQDGQPAEGRYWLLEQEPSQRPNLLDPGALGRTIDAVVDGMAAGAFPAVPGPGEYNNCTYCRYTLICPADRQTQAEHKEAEPLFAAGTAAAAAVVTPDANPQDGAGPQGDAS